MKPTKIVLIAVAIAAFTASSAVAGSHGWSRHHHCFPRHHARFFFDFGFPLYPYGYNYYPAPRVVIYATAPADNSVVVEVQKRLARGGYYRGAIDGVIGDETRRAIRAYERGHGLPVDGRLDRQLLATMGLA